MINVYLEQSQLTAHLKESITYGEHQSIQTELMKSTKGSIDPVTQKYSTDFDASATIDWTYKKILTVVKSFTDKEGNEIENTKQFIENLPMLDGQTLDAETDKILNGIKKK